MDKKFKEHLEKLEDPNYEGESNFILPKNASALDKSKYELCQNILGYKQDYKLTTEQIAKKLKLTIPKTNRDTFS